VDDILDVIDEANAGGQRVVVATVIDTIRSAPRQPGAKMIVREDGTFVGSVSGGCVEADVVERAKHVFAGEVARRIHYGVTDGEAWEVGLSCGGEIDVWVEEADPGLWNDVRALLDSDGYGMLYTDTNTGEKRLEADVLESTGLREDGIFAEVIEGPIRVVIFGAAEAAEHLCAYGKQLGWRTTVVDARAALATRERMPSAGEIVKADWVLSAADGHTTIYEMLGGKYRDKAVDAAYDNFETFPSYLQVSLGVARDLSDQPGYVTRVVDEPLEIDPQTALSDVSFRLFHFDPTFAP
jgi:xanthine/CO dehydrogenase XdhC/CoxF family maturation factor